jgi:hypothetical protein
MNMNTSIYTDDRAGCLNGDFFMGEGHIWGVIHYSAGYDDGVELEFDAYWRRDQSMTSEISPTEAREIWASLEPGQDSISSDSDSYDDY